MKVVLMSLIVYAFHYNLPKGTNLLPYQFPRVISDKNISEIWRWQQKRKYIVSLENKIDPTI